MSATFTATLAARTSALLGRAHGGLLFSGMIEDDANSIARGLKSSDPDLLDRLIEQYQHRLFRYLVHLTGNRERAEDFFQDTWMRVLERGNQYNAKWKFESWLFTIARNLVIDWQRKSKPLSLDELVDPAQESSASFEPAAPGDQSPLHHAEEEESAFTLRASLREIPAAYREVLLLRFHEDLELNEIASITNTPISTVKSRLYRGLEAMRKLLPWEQSL
jgi:RNA polymerase sigma-70 factor, ECF subfamily